MTPDEREALRAKHYNAAVASRRDVNPDLAIFRVRPDFAIPAHKPGQYSTLGLGMWEPRIAACQPEPPHAGPENKLVRRAYSFSCSVLDASGALLDLAATDYLEFYVVLVREAKKDPPPALTPRLFALREGDRLFLGEKITGHFTLDPVKPTDTVVFLSTGTGEAPHNYMLWQLLRGNHQGRILAACCVRYRQDLGYLDIQRELARRYPNYTYVPLTTREPETVHRKVYIQDLIKSGQLEELLGSPLDPRNTHVFLCGNPAMIGVPSVDRSSGAATFPQPAGVIEILCGRGFRVDPAGGKEFGNIHFEKYW